MQTLAPYGFWQSPISSDLLTRNSVTPSYVKSQGDTLFWLEARPAEKGRQAIVAQLPDGTKRELLPATFSARTQLLEYGGCPYFLCGDLLVFSNASDQNLYALAWQQADASPYALTAMTDTRFGDGFWDAQRQRLIVVVENCSVSHQESELFLAAIDIYPEDKNPTPIRSIATILSRGADFYAYPSVSPCGLWLSWLCWSHPALPWDNTQCYLAPINSDGLLGEARIIAGAEGNHSINQPQFGPDGCLYWVSDVNNWWNIYRCDLPTLTVTALTQLPGECAQPRWVSGMSSYGFLTAHTILFTYCQNGGWTLAELNITTQVVSPVATSLDYFVDIFTTQNAGYCIAAASTQPAGIFHYAEGVLTALSNIAPPCDPDYFSTPQNIQFPTSQNSQAYAFYYPPHHPQCVAPAQTFPPLIIVGHGGPTSAASTALNLKIQFWTSRGFAVMDVNYRGSTGFGRDYRHSLNNQWGVADVDDLCAAADFATQQGWAHPRLRFIKGSSAGGYSVLAALCFHQTFNAGVSLYGIADLTALAQDTHKFEARYLDNLIGPYPAQADLYYQRSPLHFAHQIKCPLLVFQGLLDKVVPPNQAQQMVTAVRAQGTSVTYIEFPDEGHGFRQAHNIIAQLDAELDFYQQLLTAAYLLTEQQ